MYGGVSQKCKYAVTFYSGIEKDSRKLYTQEVIWERTGGDVTSPNS